MDELFNAALMETDEVVAWNAVSALHWRGSREVFERAAALGRSACSIERRIGADVLAQLGVPERTFPYECETVLLAMLERENDADVQQTILLALSHVSGERRIAASLAYTSHADENIRYAVVHCLTGCTEPAAINALIRLTCDPDSDVRDWATFGLGSLMDLNSPAICDALFNRLDDEDRHTRCEALVGLAMRHDRRAIAAIQKELAGEMVGLLAVEAAELMGAPELLPHLRALKNDWETDAASVLQSAISACTPRP